MRAHQQLAAQVTLEAADLDGEGAWINAESVGCNADGGVSSGQAIQTIAGQPFDPQLAGPSDFAWGPDPQDVGSVAFLTTDGGVTAPPPDGIIRPAKLLRVDLPGS